MDLRSVAFCLCIFNCYFSTCHASHCGTMQNITYAKIPGVNTLMSLYDFEKYVVNNEMGRVYIVLTADSPMATAPGPDINFFSTIKVDGKSDYIQNTFGETRVVNPQCSSSSTRLTRLQIMSDSAIFSLQDKSIVLAFWSSCPTKYVWSMQCSKYNLGHRKCLLQDVMFGIYVQGTLDDVPMNDIVKDLCEATGVKFGVQNFKWFFTYGQNTKCRAP